jgi:phosphatidylglycerophosphatase A
MSPNPVRKLYRALAYACATCAGLGYSPVAPGTVGSAAAVGIFLLFEETFVARPLVFGGIILAVLVAGTLAAREVARAENNPDPGRVVVDEVVGQWLAFYGAPTSWPALAAAFLLFRLFDIWKPFPIRSAEKLGGGVGVMLDDVLAGLYTRIVLAAALAVPAVRDWLA